MQGSANGERRITKTLYSCGPLRTLPMVTMRLGTKQSQAKTLISTGIYGVNADFSRVLPIFGQFRRCRTAKTLI
jgi:hypothetical protein